ncbi:C-terminal regulatory domain of threonine dehydratase-domain-containing protein, partial [Ochromonadaceae sp. CCMP2298]
QDLSDNELAKSHIRHMAGGRPKICGDSADPAGLNTRVEHVFRFEFPESPGALGKFLFTLTDFNQAWTISLFHYRNHGDDYGRVLVALLVQESEIGELRAFLDKLAYTYYEEGDNPAFVQFLK